MDDNKLKYRVSFNCVPSIRRTRSALIERRFGSLRDEWQASMSDIQATRLDRTTTQLIATRRLTIDPDAEMEHLSERGIRTITRHHAEYQMV